MKRGAPSPYVTSATVTLYGVGTIARALGVTPAAIANWQRRGSGPNLPPATFVTSEGYALWTADEVRAIVAERMASMQALADTLASHVDGRG